jgi:ABC-type multidrug transport system ATPase subunit
MQLNQIKKQQGDFSLCVDSLSITKPGVYGLIGPNGSGKSTLAKIMTNLLEPDQGTVDTEGLTSRDINFLSRKPYMMDDTVYNNLVYPLQVRNVKPDQQQISTFLDMMNFSSRSKQSAKSLSSGEQQKLALLRAIIFKPRFIIADEAMTALDMDSLDHFEKTILEEQEKEKSIWIIISHQMPHIKSICNSIFFMYDGKVEIEGSAQEVFYQNDNPHLKKYLRSI